MLVSFATWIAAEFGQRNSEYPPINYAMYSYPESVYSRSVLCYKIKLHHVHHLTISAAAADNNPTSNSMSLRTKLPYTFPQSTSQPPPLPLELLLLSGMQVQHRSALAVLRPCMVP